MGNNFKTQIFLSGAARKMICYLLSKSEQ